jgi:hypothetical protein
MIEMYMLLPPELESGIKNDIYKRKRVKLLFNSLKSVMGVILSRGKNFTNDLEWMSFHGNIVYNVLHRGRYFDLDREIYLQRMAEMWDFGNTGVVAKSTSDGHTVKEILNDEGAIAIE